MKFILYTFALWMGHAAAQVPLKDGKCPDIPECKLQNKTVTPDLMTGYYYFYSYVPLFFQGTWRCNYLYSTEHFGEGGNYVFNNYAIDNATGEAYRTRAVSEVTPDGKVNVTYSYLKLVLTWEVVAIDHDYLIFHTCVTCGLLSEKGAGTYIQILTRLHAPSCETLEKINKKLNDCGIPKEYLVYVDNINCDEDCVDRPSTNTC